MAVVDLVTRIIPPDRSVVVARPGSQYWLAGHFIERSIVGPDLPHLDWAARDSASVRLSKLRRATRFRNWILRGRPVDDRPPDALAEYDGFAMDQSARQLLRVVEYFLITAKHGDLVVIPPKSLAADALIGEYVAGPDATMEYTLDKFEPFTFTGRSVRWLGSIPKKTLPGNVLETLRHPAAIVQMPRSFLSRIYQEAYGSYVDGERYVTQFDVSSDKYTVSDDINALGFFKFVAYNLREIDQGTARAASIEEAAFADAADYASDLSTEISSPGFLTLGSKYLVPMVSSALFALAVELGPAAYAQIEEHMLTIGNSAAPADDPCALRVQEQIYDYMVLVGAERWARACEIARLANENNGLKSHATVKNE